MQDSYLTIYLNFTPKTGADELSNELFKLQSLYEELGLGVMNINEYKNQEILDYTYDRVSDSFSLQPLRGRVFRNKVLSLSVMEKEHVRLFNEVMKQIEKVDSLLNLRIGK